ncbi:hypothetical protein GCM10023214_74740 [Amycolatopsis dongchuanensis]|uniref:Uncharacterized protein n=1 Tax=Amycolatopsis dongchuanensis TaxID=1070866 RepID=A0ABP8VS92_9PSEU
MAERHRHRLPVDRDEPRRLRRRKGVDRQTAAYQFPDVGPPGDGHEQQRLPGPDRQSGGPDRERPFQFRRQRHHRRQVGQRIREVGHGSDEFQQCEGVAVGLRQHAPAQSRGQGGVAAGEQFPRVLPRQPVDGDHGDATAVQDGGARRALGGEHPGPRAPHPSRHEPDRGHARPVEPLQVVHAQQHGPVLAGAGHQFEYGAVRHERAWDRTVPQSEREEDGVPQVRADLVQRVPQRCEQGVETREPDFRLELGTGHPEHSRPGLLGERAGRVQ